MTAIADLRREYASRALDEASAEADPMRQFERWFDEAAASQILDVNAMTLATTTATGDPAARIVLLVCLESGPGRLWVRERGFR